MTVLTIATKAAEVRKAFGKLAGEYIIEGQHAKSVAVQKAVMALDAHNESLAKLYDILTASREK